jgi:hypothetical protein
MLLYTTNDNIKTTFTNTGQIQKTQKTNKHYSTSTTTNKTK